MKKTLIALTLASLSVTASADVILYGKIRGGVEVNRNFTSGIPDKGTVTKIVDYGSLIGFKGHEDLNNNLRAIWQVEQDVSIGGPGDGKGFSTRDSFVGLTGGFGTAKAGYLSTPTKTTNDRLDQWEYSDNAAGLGIYTRSNAAVGRKGAISYETPNFGGFTAQAYVSPSDNNGDTDSVTFATKNDKTDEAVYGAKLSYENAGFFADVAGTYLKNSVFDANNKGHDGYQAAANVGFENNNWLAGVGYQQARYVDDVGSLLGEHKYGSTAATSIGANELVKGSKEVVASAAYTINNAVRLKGSAAYGFDIDSLTTSGASSTTTPVLKDAKYVQGIIGADYLMSKRTTLNGQVGYLELKDGNSNKYKKGTVGVGMTHKF